MLLKDKIVVIFGGSGAIGRAVAHVMAREGAHVCLGARSQEKLNRVADDIRGAVGGGCGAKHHVGTPANAFTSSGTYGFSGVRSCRCNDSNGGQHDGGHNNDITGLKFKP